MTQAEMYTKAIDFQNFYIAVDRAFADAKTEAEKIAFVARKFFNNSLDTCRNLADFIREKAGGLLNRNALISAQEDYLENLKQEKESADEAYKNNIDSGVVEKAEQDLGVAEKKANKAKRKSRINLAFKLTLLCLCAFALASGSLAVFSPIINAVTLLLGGLSGASLMALGAGIWLYYPKIKEWWNSKDKDKGKNRYLGDYFQKESEKADKAVKEAGAELGSKKGERAALGADAKTKAKDLEQTEREFESHPHNQEAREHINQLIHNMVDGLHRCETDPNTSKQMYARTTGRELLREVITRLKKAFADNKITDENYVAILEELAKNFIGDDGIFNPASPVAPDNDTITRLSIFGDGKSVDEEEFWA